MIEMDNLSLESEEDFTISDDIIEAMNQDE
jgi:hypothetical protein